MTPWDLQKSLIAEIEELLAQMQLKNVAGEDVFGVKATNRDCRRSQTMRKTSRSSSLTSS